MKKIYSILGLLLVLSVAQIKAQQNIIPKNTYQFVPWTDDLFNGLSIGTSDWGSTSNNNNALKNNTTIASAGINSVTDSRDSLRIVHSGNIYSGGNIVGFRGTVQTLTTDITVELSTWNGSLKVESKTFNNSLLSTLLGSSVDFTMETTLPYTSVQIKISTSLLAGFDVQYAIVKAFDSGASFDCNLPTLINSDDHPFILDETLTQKIGVVTASDFNDILNPSTSNNFSFTPIAAGGIALALRDKVHVYNDPYFVGFDLTSNSLLDISALGTMQIRTYLNGVLQETVAMSSSTASATLIGGNKQRVGFVTEKPFNTIQYYQNGVSVGLGAITITNLVMTKFCEADDLDCNETVNLNNPDHSVYINNARTGVGGAACVNCSINGASNILDNDPNTYATMNMVASAGTTLGLSVKDAMRSYAAGTYAGFDIVTQSLINLSLLNGITLETYLDDELVESFTGNTLLGLGSSFVGGVTTSKIGILANAEFDEIRLVLSGALGGDLGTTQVHNVFITRMCDVNTLDCNIPTTLGFPEYPVLINSINTNINAVGCAGCSLNNVNNIIDGDLETTATITLAGGVLTTAQVSVLKAEAPFDATTFIGIPIEMVSLVDFNVLTNIELIAYNNGVEVSRADGNTNSLLTLNSGAIFSTQVQTIGFVPGAPFDELVMKLTIPASINAGSIHLYDVIVQQFCNRTINCNETVYLNQGGTNGMPVYINYGGTGSSGVACLDCTVDHAEAVISEDGSDVAILNVAAGIGNSTSIAVKDALNVYPFGTYVGFTVQSFAGFVQADLFKGITISTYLDGVFQESRTSVSLLDLSLLGLPIFAPGPAMYNVGFKVTKEFNEIRLTAGQIAGVGVLDGLRVYGAWVDTRESNGGNLYCHKQANPDMTVVLKDYSITGNLATNDIMPSGVEYSDWTAHPDNPTGAIFSTNTDGTYTFESNTVGEYYYFYTVKVTDDLNYPTFVKISVRNGDISTGTEFPVIVNPDYANVLSGRSATVKVLLNDAPGNDLLALNPASLRISTNPNESGKYGTVTINPDASITYTPDVNYIGKDSIRYFVSDNHTPEPNESSSWVVFHVYPSDYVNTVVANNDFKATKYAVSGNLLENDQDPEDNQIGLMNDGTGRFNNSRSRKLSVAAARNYNGPEGDLTVQPDGTYTFEPAPGFKGTFQYVYSVEDNNADESATNKATLSILVSDSYTLPIIIESFDVKQQNGKNILEWKTSLEDHAKHFVIERSTDGQNFIALAEVKADNSSVYRYEDATSINGKVYYRLKLVDQDDSYNYSSIKMVEQANQFNLTVYPNPAVNGRTYLHTGQYSGMVNIVITDASGRNISQSQMQVQPNSSIQLSQLPISKGIYYLMIMDSKGNRILQTKILHH